MYYNGMCVKKLAATSQKGRADFENRQKLTKFVGLNEPVCVKSSASFF